MLLSFRYCCCCCCLPSFAYFTNSSWKVLALLLVLVSWTHWIMLGLLLLFKLVIMLRFLEGLWLFLKISAYVGFSVFSFFLKVVSFEFCFKLLNFFNFGWYRIFLLMLHLIWLFFGSRRIQSFLTVVWIYIRFGQFWCLFLCLFYHRRRQYLPLNSKKNLFSLEYQLSIKIW